jgi:hypothetical protein
MTSQWATSCWQTNHNIAERCPTGYDGILLLSLQFWGNYRLLWCLSAQSTPSIHLDMSCHPSPVPIANENGAIVMHVLCLFPGGFGVCVRACVCVLLLLPWLLAVLSQTVEDALAAALPCFSPSPTWSGSRASPIWLQVHTHTNKTQPVCLTHIHRPVQTTVSLSHTDVEGGKLKAMLTKSSNATFDCTQIRRAVRLESIQTPCLFSHFLTLQPYSKID